MSSSTFLHPPTTRPVCLDTCFDHGSGWQAIPTASAFSGGGLRFSAHGGGAWINPETGVLHVPTGRPQDGMVIRVQVENDAGQAEITLTVTVEDDEVRAETALTARLEIDGFTFLFDRPVPVGHFVSGGGEAAGDPFVIGPVRLLDYSPSPGRLGERHINGAMLNPPCTRKTGFDGLANRDSYDPGLNAGLGLPLDLVPGDRLVVSRSNPDAARATEAIEAFTALTCLAEAPFEDCFRPPYSGPEIPLWRLSDLRLDRLASLSVVEPVPDELEPDVLSERFKRVAVDIIPNWNRRLLEAELHAPVYGRDLCGNEAVPFVFINCDWPLDEKAEVLIGLVQRGIDRYGVFLSALDQGFHPWRADGAHNSGRKTSILIAGQLLDDVGMLSVTAHGMAVEGSFQEDEMTFYVSAEDVAVTYSDDWRPGYRNDPSRAKQPYTEAMIGMPDWRGKGRTDHGNAAWSGNPYRIGGNNNTQHGHVLALLAMDLREAWGHDAYFDYHMRYTAIMNGDPDPWRFRGGSVSLYDPVTGSEPAEGWAGWQRHWDTPWTRKMLEAHRDRFYRYPWD